MDLRATLDAPCSPEVLFAQVDDLARYPAWLGIVARADSAAAMDGDPGPAWVVDLRARLGPLARSKRLRMVRAECTKFAAVRVERREDDGRTHARWLLEAEVAPIGEGSRLAMRLHYGGGLLGPVIERLLAEEVERAKPRLLALVS
ncbi:hypothetical protein BH18ACT1_BH18ACT1_15090 [soil metagenome]